MSQKPLRSLKWERQREDASRVVGDTLLTQKVGSPLSSGDGQGRPMCRYGRRRLTENTRQHLALSLWHCLSVYTGFLSTSGALSSYYRRYRGQGSTPALRRPPFS